jgi:cytochrome c-type biogenesis protein CcmH
LLAVAALAFVLPTLLGRGRSAKGTAGDAANIVVYRDQLKELDADLAAGTLSRDRYEEARREIEHRVLEDVHENGSRGPGVATQGRATLISIVVAVPLVAALVYLAVGNPAALKPESSVADGHGITAQQIEGLIEQLAARMRENPDDAKGWTMLARSYAVLDRYPEAAAAYANAIKRSPPDAQLLADYADVLAMTQGRNLQGEPERMIAEALRIDPANVKALALAGTLSFEKKDFNGAIGHWQKILDVVPAKSEIAEAVRDSIADARQLAPGGATPAQTGVTGTVRLSPALISKASPDDTVFVFARPADGPRTPLAVVRKQVRDLPVTFALDDSMAMTPAARLSNYEQIIVGARVSKSGNPMPQPGDLEGISPPARIGSAGISVTIDSVVR